MAICKFAINQIGGLQFYGNQARRSELKFSARGRLFNSMTSQGGRRLTGETTMSWKPEVKPTAPGVRLRASIELTVIAADGSL